MNKHIFLFIPRDAKALARIRRHVTRCEEAGWIPPEIASENEILPHLGEILEDYFGRKFHIRRVVGLVPTAFFNFGELPNKGGLQ